MAIDFSRLSKIEAEDRIMQELPFVDLLGQLPLEKDNFFSLCDLIKRNFIFGKKLLVQQVPPAIFLTSMVFTARYSDLNQRNFWKPYGRLVWGQENISQALYKKFQNKFKESIYFLESKFDINFPRRLDGDVVRPVYRHAIIPFYLQDYFAEWIKSKWREILLIPAEDLVSQLQLDNSYHYLPPTLKSFIEDKDTEDTAKELLTTISTAASYFSNGETPENIDLLLSPSPIHKSLWNELLKVFQEQEQEIKARKNGPVFEWVWAVEENVMQVRIQNMIVQSKEQPDRFVWTKQGESPVNAKIEARVLPWKTDNGWLIDICYIGPGPQTGQIVLLGEYGSILAAENVPKLPEDQPIMIFRLSQQNVYGIPVDLGSNLISDGQWLVSMGSSVKILDERGQELRPSENRPVPSPLDSKGHTTAGIFDITLPITITQNELQLESLEKRRLVGHTPIIEGSKSGTVTNLSNNVPPAFTESDIWLVLPNAPSQVVSKGTLWLKNSSGTWLHPLKYLEQKGVAAYTKGALRVSIGKLIQDNAIATYSLQIITGLHPLFASPLEFAYLPGVRIRHPDPHAVYSPTNHPECSIKGLDLNNVKVREGNLISQRNNGEIKIAWSDVRDDPLLHIQKSNERVSLSWALQRTTAWISPTKDSYTLDEFKNCEFHVLSTTQAINAISVKVGGDDISCRTIQLGKKGSYSSVIKNDPVFDLVREKPTQTVQLFVEMGQSHWLLGEIQKTVSFASAEVNVHYDLQRYVIEFRCSLERPWSGETRFICCPLLDPSEEIVLEETDHLTSKHLFKCELRNGFYILQIIHQGEKVLSSPLYFSITSDSSEQKIDLVALQPFLADRSASAHLYHALQEDFATFVISSFSDDLLLSYPDLLYRLLTLNAFALRLRKKQLAEISPLITAVIDAHNKTISKRSDGLIPAWVVMDRPLYLKLILPLKPITIKIFPLLTKNQATSGIGYTYLRVRGEQAEADPVFVKWDIQADANRYDVLLGLPDNSNTNTYPKLDEFDVWPLKQCKYCGYLIVTRRTAKDEYLYEQHKHGYRKPNLVDITYDYDLIARPSITEIPEKLRYFEKPDDSARRELAIQIAAGTSEKGILTPANPVSLEYYLFAIRKIRVRNIENDASYINGWFQVRSWQDRFNHFEKLLSNSQVDIPAFGPAFRLIECMRSDGGYSWLNLDKQFLMLALLLRGQAFHQGQTLKILKELGLTINDLIDMVELAKEIGPELLCWSLTWAEIFYLHALC